MPVQFTEENKKTAGDAPFFEDVTGDQWERCYPSNWKGLIVPQAMSHPAKFSSKLIRRIYEHMLEQGWLRVGDTVIDPFGGVALGALEAMRHGLNWTGIELEPKFVDLGTQNIASWNKRFSLAMPHWGSAVLLQGDSRYILKVLDGENTGAISSPPYSPEALGHSHGEGPQSASKNRPDYQEANARLDAKTFYGENTPGQLGSMDLGNFQSAVSSPPYEAARIGQESGQEHCGHGDQYGETPGNLGAMKPGNFSASITSPPFRHSEGGTPEPQEGGSIDNALYERHAAGNSAAQGYGVTEGNLANMGEPKNDFMAAIASPPYSATRVEKNSTGIDLPKQYDIYKASGGGQTFEAFVKTQELHSQGYGHSAGQLSDLPSGNFDATISSPPFEKGSEGVLRADKFKDPEAFARVQMTRGNGASFDAKMRAMQKDNERAEYGDTEGNIGNDQGETFWSAARQIIEQVYLALAPGAHAVWVVKDYVKNKQRVPFSAQWRQLCESVGFITLHEHHASLVHHKGKSNTLEGGVVTHTTESKSFFRRLAEKKGSPRIDYETVFCMVKNK